MSFPLSSYQTSVRRWLSSLLSLPPLWPCWTAAAPSIAFTSIITSNVITALPCVRQPTCVRLTLASQLRRIRHRAWEPWAPPQVPQSPISHAFTRRHPTAPRSPRACPALSGTGPPPAILLESASQHQLLDAIYSTAALWRVVGRYWPIRAIPSHPPALPPVLSASPLPGCVISVW